jgi:acyl-[acyl-carrier-protein]-phospholipid O-acyltransferase / long-chain-fatty-acid--[acyl-carrier-protein] ligase
VLFEDGWYITGDIARMDHDGFITITDRVSRFSKIAGEMIPHIHVEDALHKALGVHEPRFAVTAVPDDTKGEKLVVLHTDIDVPVEELLKRLREQGMPTLWIPRRDNFFRVETLPILGSGKVDLFQLKKLAKEFSETAPAAQ